jgi:hypothetical protein
MRLTCSFAALILAWLGSCCHLAHAQYTTILNVPPDVAPITVLSGTQVNVFDGGGFGGRFNNAVDGSEVNLFGGQAGLVFQAGSGSRVNVYDGDVGFGFTAHGGSQVSVFGGEIDDGFSARAGSQVRISGGAFSNRLDFEAGSDVTFSGGDFRIDGVPVSGLDSIGDTVDLSLPADSIFTGVFSDGTPFAITTKDRDAIAEGAVTLLQSEIPAAGDGVTIASRDGVPRGVRTGQTLIVDEGALLGNYFNIAGGGELEVQAGGGVLEGLEAVDANIRVIGGSIGRYLDLFAGSTLELFDGEVGAYTHIHDQSHANIRGGAIGYVYIHDGGSLTLHDGDTSSFFAYAGSRINVRGGYPIIDAESGSNLQFFGADFRLNGVPVDLSNAPHEGLPIDVPLGSNLSGVLANGDPFVLQHGQYDVLPHGTIHLSSEAPPPAPHLDVVTSRDGAAQHARAGQRVLVNSLLGMPDKSTVFYADGVTVTAEGSISSNFNAIGTPIEVRGGTIGGGFSLFQGSNLMLIDGAVGLNGDLFPGSQMTMLNGTLGSGLSEHAGASLYVAGGDIGALNVTGDVVITGGSLSSGFNIFEGGSILLAGGLLPGSTSTTPDFDASAGSEIHIYGTEFLLNGEAIPGLDYGDTLTIQQRGSVLSGVLLDGSSFELELEIRTDPSCCTRPNYIDRDALLTITKLIPGDHDRNGAVDATDLADWSTSFGVDAIGDADFDSDSDGRDLLIWQRNLGRGVVSPVAAVPEPALVVQLAVAMTSLQVMRRRRQLVPSATHDDCRTTSRRP